MAATPEIGRKLTYKRRERQLLQRAIQLAAALSPVIPTPLSDREFEAALDELAEGSENRTAPAPEVFSREHIYEDHD